MSKELSSSRHREQGYPLADEIAASPSSTARQSFTIAPGVTVVGYLDVPTKATATDFPANIDRNKVTFTVFAKTTLPLRAALREIVNAEGKEGGCYPALAKPLKPDVYQLLAGISCEIRFQQGELPHPFGTYIISAPTRGGDHAVIGSCGIMKSSLHFNLQQNTPARGPAILDAHMFFDVICARNGMEQQVVDLALPFMGKQALRLANRERSPVKAVMVTTKEAFARQVALTHQFILAKEPVLKTFPRVEPGEVPHYILTKTFDAGLL